MIKLNVLILFRFKTSFNFIHVPLNAFQKTTRNSVQGTIRKIHKSNTRIISCNIDIDIKILYWYICLFICLIYLYEIPEINTLSSTNCDVSVPWYIFFWLSITSRTHVFMLHSADPLPGFACDSEFKTLFCLTNRTIPVESGYYGQYMQVWSKACCSAHVLDSQVSFEDNNPGDRSVLTAACDGKDRCEFQNPGRDAPSCASQYNSHYALIYKTCWPGK